MIEYISNGVSEFEKSVIRKMNKAEIMIFGTDGVRVIEIPPKTEQEAINEALLESPD